MIIHSLYKITLPGGRSYIGRSKTERLKGTRWKEHCRRKDNPISDEIRKAGIENVRFCELARGSYAYICELEKAAIIRFGTRWPKGFNMSGGGASGRESHHPLSRMKIAVAVSKFMRGRPKPPRTQEHIENQRKSQLATFERQRILRGDKRVTTPRFTDAERAALVQANINSPEAVKKRAESRRGRKNTGMSASTLRRRQQEERANAA